MEKETLLKKAQIWARGLCFDKKTRKEVSELIKQEDFRTLEEMFGASLEFGTGGIRGIVGAGTARLNPYTVRRATTALALYIKDSFSQSKTLKVAITFDSRVSSKGFSEMASEVLAYHGIHVYLTKELRPTPALSFMVRHFKCQAGICITASHNPPSYNGYKVYWEDGGQVVRPHDKEIITRFEALDDYSKLGFLDFKEAVSKGFIHYCDDELDEAYLKVIAGVLYRNPQKREQKIVYTPLHGAGITLLPEALRQKGFKNVLLVPEQKEPDGSFPTVSSPNPEDQEALVLGKKFGDEQEARILLATDPDADRLGVSVKEEGKWTDLNGNQIAILLTHYILSALQEKSIDLSDSYVVKTVVTTELLPRLTKHFGAECFDTLTGFKWIADLILQKESLGKKFLCGGEESIGFLAESYVRDKDSIVTASVFCEMMAYYDDQDISILEALDKIYASFGFYHESLKSLALPGFDGREKIEKIMKHFRSFQKDAFFGESLVGFYDYKNQDKILKESGFKKEGFSDFPLSNVLSFSFESGLKVMMRPSGTEAKIKFYFFHHEKKVDLDLSLDKRKEKITSELSFFQESFMKKVTEVLN